MSTDKKPTKPLPSTMTMRPSPRAAAKPVKTGRRGLPCYDTNPFMDAFSVDVKKQNLTVSRGAAVLNPDSNEIEASTTIQQHKWVDKTQFVKIFIGELTAFFDLKPAAYKMLMVCFTELKRIPGQDKIFIPFAGIQTALDDVGITLSRPTYDRGITELIEKKFLAAGVFAGWYYINPALIFNGDRAAFVRTYQIKPEKNKQKALEAAGQNRLDFAEETDE